MLVIQNYKDYKLKPGIVSTSASTQIDITLTFSEQDLQTVDIQLCHYIQSLKENLLSIDSVNGFDGFITIRERNPNNKDQFKADYKYYPLHRRLNDKFYDRINQAFEKYKKWLNYFSKDEAFNILEIQDYVKNHKLNIFRNVKGFCIKYGDKILPIYDDFLPKKIPNGIIVSKSFSQSLLDEVLKDIVVDRLKDNDEYLKPMVISG